MNKDVLVSISCITYNHVNYIRQCLDGFIMQKTNFAFEVLIHDDCSTDGTIDIIREYTQKYPDIIKPLYEEVNQYQNGLPSGSSVWNFPRANGKYIAMCEGDDYWSDSYKLQKQVDFLEDNDDYGLVYTDFQVLRDGVFYPSNIGKCYEGNVFLDLLTRDNKIATLTVCFRRELLDKINTNFPSFFKMKDLPLWIEMSRVSQYKYISEITSVYRRLHNSASHSNDFIKQMKFYRNCYEVRRYYASEYNIEPAVKELHSKIRIIDALCALYKFNLLSFFCLKKNVNIKFVDYKIVIKAWAELLFLS